LGGKIKRLQAEAILGTSTSKREKGKKTYNFTSLCRQLRREEGQGRDLHEFLLLTATDLNGVELFSCHPAVFASRPTHVAIALNFPYPTGGKCINSGIGK
jgi:hypothetical protein